MSKSVQAAKVSAPGAAGVGTGSGTHAPGAGRQRGRYTSLWRGVAGVVILVGLLEVISVTGLVDNRYVPPLFEVLERAGELLGDSDFVAAVGTTLKSTLVGLAISSAIGIVSGTVFGLSATVFGAFRWLIELLRPVPPVALIPLAILTFGTGLAMKSAVVLAAGTWPVMFNTISGIRGTDPQAIEMARSFRKRPLAVLGSVIMRSAAPQMFAGIRIACSISLMVVVATELITGGAGGLGSFIQTAGAAGDRVTDVYAATFMAGVLGLAINLVLGYVQRRWFPQPGARNGQSR